MTWQLPAVMPCRNEIDGMKTRFVSPEVVPFGRLSSPPFHLEGQVLEIDRDVEISIFHGPSAKHFAPW